MDKLLNIMDLDGPDFPVVILTAVIRPSRSTVDKPLNIMDLDGLDFPVAIFTTVIRPLPSTCSHSTRCSLLTGR